MQFSDDSSEYEHPNIEKGTLKRLVREKKQREKEEKIKELETIKSQSAENCTPEMEKRRILLEEQLKPKFVETINYTHENKPIEKDQSDVYTEIFLFLGSDPTIENFIEFVDNNKTIDLNDFCDFLYMNLSENIKDGYDEAGFVISKLIMFFKTLREGGIPLLKNLKIGLEEESKKINFENECHSFFQDSKYEILKLHKEQQ